MSNRKITRRRPPVQPQAPKASGPPKPPGAQPASSAKLTPEEAAYIKADQELIEKLGRRVAKVFISPKASWEQGVEIVDELALEFTEAIMKRFRGLLGLADLVAVFGSIVGNQAGINVVKGQKPPLTPGQFSEAQGLFKAAMQLNYSSTITEGGKKVQVVKKMPGGLH